MSNSGLQTEISSTRAFLILVAAGAGAVLLGLWIRSLSPQGDREGLDGQSVSLELTGGTRVGEQFPKIAAEGWVNGTGPTPESLQGKVVVVDAWATYCVKCRALMPNLAKVHEKYNSRVTFIGLTTEDSAFMEQINAFLRDCNVTWTNGYGAYQTLLDAQAEFIPRVWVIGKDGKVVWNTDSHEPIEKAIDAALAASAT